MPLAGRLSEKFLHSYCYLWSCQRGVRAVLVHRVNLFQYNCAAVLVSLSGDLPSPRSRVKQWALKRCCKGRKKVPAQVPRSVSLSAWLKNCSQKNSQPHSLKWKKKLSGLSETVASDYAISIKRSLLVYCIFVL